MPHHWLIKWRSLDVGVHCVVVRNSDGDLYNPTFAGIKTSGKYGNLSYYKGRSVTIVRCNTEVNQPKLINWCNKTVAESEGYDFFGQWLLGFVLGMFTNRLANNPKAWTCAEFPYWAFQDNGIKLTSTDEILPLPRLFKYSNRFTKVFQGVV
jgi:hypothetical protein